MQTQRLRYAELRKRGLPALLAYYSAYPRDLHEVPALMAKGLVACIQDNTVTIQEYPIAIRRGLEFDTFVVSRFLRERSR